jgi:serine/threonine protein kinase
MITWHDMTPSADSLLLLLLQGGTLMHKVSQSMISPGRQVYSNAQALGWALDVACALQYLHQRSPAVLHRDVKLSNVLLAKQEGGYVAKLSDFGLHVVSSGPTTAAPCYLLKQQQLQQPSSNQALVRCALLSTTVLPC